MSTFEQQWEEYSAAELKRATPILAKLGFTLDAVQPHLGGERYLHQAVTTTAGPKLILLGARISDKLRVVIKVTSNAAGAREINAERRARAVLPQIAFAYQPFYAPAEVLYTESDGMTIAIQEFIEQQHSFLERPLREQFTLALQGFKIQEGAHATTYGHLKRIARTFSLWGAREYLAAARSLAAQNKDVPEVQRGLAFLTEHQRSIEQYSGFLTHTDFLPHNIRIRDNHLYLLDHSSIRFGNKYDGWGRFIHFMVLYNPPLADALIEYVRVNRAPEESVALRVMRVFRLIEITAHYAGTLPRSEGNLHTLNRARLAFWTAILRSVLDDKPLASSVREEYIKTRDALRSEAERERQKGLH